MAETVWQATRATEEGQCQVDAGMYYVSFGFNCCTQQQCLVFRDDVGRHLATCGPH